jgi:hypothetical protein
LWVAVSTVMSFLTGCGSFVYLVATGNGNLVLVIGCWAFAGLIPPLVALERLVAFRTGSAHTQPPSSPPSSQSSGPSSPAQSASFLDGGDR